MWILIFVPSIYHAGFSLSLLLSVLTAHVNNVLTFCLLVPKSSTSLESLKACLGCTSSVSCHAVSSHDFHNWISRLGLKKHQSLNAVQHRYIISTFFCPVGSCSSRLFWSFSDEIKMTYPLWCKCFCWIQSLNRQSGPSASFHLYLNPFLPLSLLLFLHLPLYPAMPPLVAPAFPSSHLRQLTEESCPPFPSEVPDPHWEMEMPHHCLSAHCASWFSPPSITRCVFMSAGIRSAGIINWHVCCPQCCSLTNWQAQARYWRGYVESWTYRNFINKSFNYGRLDEHQPSLGNDTESESLPL